MAARQDTMPNLGPAMHAVQPSIGEAIRRDPQTDITAIRLREPVEAPVIVTKIPDFPREQATAAGFFPAGERGLARLVAARRAEAEKK